MAFPGTRFDLGFGLCYGGKLVFTTGDLGGNGKPFGVFALVGGFGQGKQFANFLFELGFELARVFMGQRAVTAGVGVEFGAVKADAAESAELVGLGDLQDLHEEDLEPIAEATTESGEGVVVGVTVAGKVAKGDGVVG